MLYEIRTGLADYIFLLEVAATDRVTSPQLISREHGDFYPAASMRQGEQGNTGIALAIDASGHVVDCKIATSSGFPALDAQSCAIARRWWTFAPAMESGVPVSRSVRTTVKWRLHEAVAVEFTDNEASADRRLPSIFCRQPEVRNPVVADAERQCWRRCQRPTSRCQWCNPTIVSAPPRAIITAPTIRRASTCSFSPNRAIAVPKTTLVSRRAEAAPTGSSRSAPSAEL